MDGYESGRCAPNRPPPREPVAPVRPPGGVSVSGPGSRGIDEAAPGAGPSTAAAGGALLSVSTAARMLGVSPSSLRAWAAAGRVPHVRTPGGHRRFEREQLVRWLSERGGGPPTLQTRATELLPTRIDPMPDVAAVLGGVRAAVMEAFEEELARTRGSGTVRASAARHGRVTETLGAIVDGLERGDLSVFLRDAEWEGFRHGAAGQPGDGPVTEALALRRALDRELTPRLDGPERRRGIERAMDRMAVRVAAGYAEGVRTRIRAAGD